MTNTSEFRSPGSLAVPLCLVASLGQAARTQTLLDPALSVSTVVTGLEQPIAMAFLGANDFLVTEKASGQVKRVVNGAVTGVVLDLAVNSASERGLLGMALHPQFPSPAWVYLFNTESTTGADTDVLAETRLLGNRVDRFVWNGTTLVFDRNILTLRAFQEDLNAVTNPKNPFLNPGPLQRGNHNGGVLRFGPDGKLYVITGDGGRRGVLQNNLEGPVPDDQFGGPLPDDAHATGVIWRVDDDGSIPDDNPFHSLGALMRLGLPGPAAAEIAGNIQSIFAFGIRNSFGMTFDPLTGDLWTTENGGRAFDEINRVDRGFNGGWIQIMGPLSRVGDFKQIEDAAGIGMNGPRGLQQLRWPATNIEDTSHEARQDLFHLPGAHYRNPEFSWKHVVPPAALGFVGNQSLGSQYLGDLIVGSAVFRPAAMPPSVMANPGHLYRFRLSGERTDLVFTNAALQDRVADNTGVDDFVTEQAELLFGTDFGVVTDILTVTDGLYLVGTSSGTVRRIFRP